MPIRATGVLRFYIRRFENFRGERKKLFFRLFLDPRALNFSPPIRIEFSPIFPRSHSRGKLISPLPVIARTRDSFATRVVL